MSARLHANSQLPALAEQPSVNPRRPENWLMSALAVGNSIGAIPGTTLDRTPCLPSANCTARRTVPYGHQMQGEIGWIRRWPSSRHQCVISALFIIRG